MLNAKYFAGVGPYPSTYSRRCLILEIVFPETSVLPAAQCILLLSLQFPITLCSYLHTHGEIQHQITDKFRDLGVGNDIGTQCLNFVTVSGNLTDAADRLLTAVSSSSHP